MEKETPKVVKSLDRFYELLTICNNADKPNVSARKELQQLINNTPACKEAMQRQSGLYAVALRTRIEGKNATDTFKEVMYVKCRQLKEELGFSAANPLEKLAIEQIVLSWLNYHQIELQHAHVLSQSHSDSTGIYWEKRLQYASRRYERALNLLSKMRKLNLIVQVNQANNQIVSNGKKMN